MDLWCSQRFRGAFGRDLVAVRVADRRQFPHLVRRAEPPRPAARVANLTGAYIGLAGIALLVRPRRSFSCFFDPRELSAPWIRVFGALCALFGWYYRGAATGKPDGFLRATVSGRLALSVVLSSIVLFDTGPRGLLVLAFVNALGALMMHRALRQSIRGPQTSALLNLSEECLADASCQTPSEGL